MVAEALYLLNQESILEIENCEPTSYGVRCDFVYTGPVESAIFGQPRNHTERLHLESGMIVEIETQCNLTNCRPDAWDQVIDWVAETNPSDSAEMAEPWPLLAWDDAELWFEYAPLWVEAGRP
jgi:hypothetical protein